MDVALPVISLSSNMSDLEMRRFGSGATVCPLSFDVLRDSPADKEFLAADGHVYNSGAREVRGVGYSLRHYHKPTVKEGRTLTPAEWDIIGAPADHQV